MTRPSIGVLSLTAMGLAAAAPAAVAQDRSNVGNIIAVPLSTEYAKKFQDALSTATKSVNTINKLDLSDFMARHGTTVASDALFDTLGQSNITSFGLYVATESRIKSFANDISKIVSSETPETRSVLSDLQKTYQARRTPKITIAADFHGGAQMTTISSVETPRQAVAESLLTTGTLSVNETIAAAIDRASAVKSRLIDRNTIPFMTSTTILSTAAARSAAAVPLSKSYNQVFEAFTRTLDAPDSDVATTAFVDAAKNYKAVYVAQWPSIKNDPVARQAAAQTFLGLGQQRALKAQYGVLTNFEPPSYEQIYYFSRHVVSLKAGGGKICSGIALNKSWVLTAGHCFQSRSWKDIRVVFDINGRGQESKPIKIVDLWPDPTPGSRNPDKIDFAFVRVDQDSEVDGLFGELQKMTQAKPFGAEQLCIRTLPVSYKEPVFAVGYPQGQSKTVHDYSYVWFPYKISEDDFNAIGAEVYAQALAVENQTRRPQYAQAVKDSFEAGYSTIKPEGGQNFRYYYGATFGTPPRPGFGIDTDTSGGDSGSPVFDRQKRCIVGVFNGGQRDTLSAPAASWREHEFAVPITEVLAHINSVPTDQMPAGQTADAATVDERKLLMVRINEITDIR
jgi:hypothetical protein